ncbi:MAG: Aromatic/aminoadipate aminotransferase 1 [Pycnora praestabilis]|nr:MAG: Aromatic/aminoadipate aminotransferase 1 [Pycnora praestabilis]
MSPPSAINIEGVTDTESILLPSPLTINDVPSRRAKAGLLNGGVAAATNSDLFKSPWHAGKKKAKRWDRKLLSAVCLWEPKKPVTSFQTGSQLRAPSIKGLAKHLKKPGMISLGGGLPSSDYFPLEELHIKVPSVGHFSEQETRESGILMKIGKHDASEGKGVYALNYGQGTGSAQLLRFVTEHTEIVHNPPYQDWRCTMTAGNTSALGMAYRMFANRGDCILSEEYTFATAVETAAPMGVKVVGIEMDDQGLIPESMDEILNTWDVKARGADKPFILYTVPSGQNPTGATQGLQRRRQIYKIAQKHDLYIFEDEPYYFLQMQPYAGPNVPDVPPPASHNEFVKALVPSLLSLDIDGRVMRMDSFSKVIAPGTRCGWITASEQIVNKIIQHNEASIQNPSGISQLVLYKLLDENWGHGGYLDWLINLRIAYTERRNIILHACERFLPREVTTWNPPAAGMFLWMKLDVKKHPHAGSKTVIDIENEILEASIDRNVLVVPGSWFRAEKDVEPSEMYFRATFAAAASEKMTEAIRRFGDAVKASFEI